MLTPFDEMPVHQHSRPFSHVPSSDLGWDDGYYFGFYNPDAKTFVYTGLRVVPNTGVVGAYAGVSVAGVQLTTRMSRRWRDDFTIGVGPLHYEFEEAFQRIRLVLEPVEGRFAFDLTFHAIAPPHLEEHHFARRGNRVTTDQSRYVQCGTAEGKVHVNGRDMTVTPREWWSTRDHSWGIYEARRPLSPESRWLPPADAAPVRAMRFWLLFQTPGCAGFVQIHEDESGTARDINDVFGTGFQGAIDIIDGPSNAERRTLTRADHELEFVPGTRSLLRARLTLHDSAGGEWLQELELTSPPWSPLAIGYEEGTWMDGGSIHTWHGPDEPYVEMDELDLSNQPTRVELHNGRVIQRLFGVEHLVRVRTRTPEGEWHSGAGQLEMFVSKRHPRYGRPV